MAMEFFRRAIPVEAMLSAIPYDDLHESIAIRSRFRQPQPVNSVNTRVPPMVVDFMNYGPLR